MLDTIMKRLALAASNIRFAIRSLAHVPVFSLTIVLTLAITIGANTAVYSALDAVLFKPLPFPDADRLVSVSQTIKDNSVNNVGPARLEDWNERSSTFEAMTGYYTEDVSDTSGDLPERMRKANVAPRFFDVWQIAPELGHAFAASDHEAGAAPVAVISNRYWRRRFDADPDVVGTTIRIGENAYELVGIMPEDFAFADADVDVWVPTRYFPYVLDRRAAWYAGYARMKPGVTVEQARADLNRVQAQLSREYPDSDRDIGVAIEPLKDTTVGSVKTSLWLLFGAVSVLLLIACTNIAAMLLARASERRREAAVRLAIGSSRASIALRAMTESAVLVVGGTGIGLALAVVATRTFRRLAPALPRVDEITVDGKALLYTLASVVAVTILCGSIPAYRAARNADGKNLTGNARWQVSARHSMQWLLVGVQVALSVMLLAGAGLLVRSFQELSHVDNGFDPHNVLTFRISGSYAEPNMLENVERIRAEVASVPGVEDAATSTPVPGVLNDRSGFDVGTAEFHVDGTVADDDAPMLAEIRLVSPEYFGVMRIALSAGESCRLAEPGGQETMLVNQVFVDRYLGGRSPLGQNIQSRYADMARIVGVSGNAREFGPDRSPVPTAYLCRAAVAYPPLSFLIRTDGDPAAIVNTVRQRLKEIEPTRSMYDVQTLGERMGAEFDTDRLRTALFALFAAAALALVCLGIYGTLTYIVSLRRREVGLRVALGAQQRNIAAQFLNKAIAVVGAAAFLGLAGSVLLSGAISSQLYGVAPTDPVTLATVVAIVLLVGCLAALAPALRAARIDPMKALRQN